MSANYKQVGPTFDQMRAMAGATDAAQPFTVSAPGAKPTPYEKKERAAIQGSQAGSTKFKFGANKDEGDSTPKQREARKGENPGKLQREPFVSKTERNFAAKAYKASLKGKTGQARKEARAELMDPGPSDDAAVDAGEESFSEKIRKYGNKIGSSVGKGENRQHGVNVSGNRSFHPGDPARYKAGAKDPRYLSWHKEHGSKIENGKVTSGPNPFINKDAKPKLPPKAWKTKTPKNYESEERKAIQSEPKAPKKSAGFP